MGNLKFDIKQPQTADFPHDYPIIIAGSTHSGEDEIILNSYIELKKEIKDLKLIIAPRHPERNANVYKLIESFNLKVSKRSQSGDFNASDVLLLDTMGELGKFYSICDIAYIGGSFNKTGGHNPLEATIFSKPVISGPCIHNFKDIYAILTNEKAAIIVNTQTELTKAFKTLLTNKDFYSDTTKACQKVFEKNNGALKFVINIIQKLV